MAQDIDGGEGGVRAEKGRGQAGRKRGGMQGGKGEGGNMINILSQMFTLQRWRCRQAAT